MTPVYAGSSFQYSRLIKTDNLIGYKSVVLDMAVYAHSNRLNDLRVINDMNEEVPYILASIQRAPKQCGFSAVFGALSFIENSMTN